MKKARRSSWAYILWMSAALDLAISYFEFSASTRTGPSNPDGNNGEFAL